MVPVCKEAVLDVPSTEVDLGGSGTKAPLAAVSVALPAATLDQLDDAYGAFISKLLAL